MAENKKMVEAITSRDEDFAKWYTDIVKKAELVDYSGVKGCMVIRPYGYALWELMQADMDRRFKETGHENVYMPMFIPESLLQRENPTSETLFCEHYKKIIKTYRDLPKLYNQWCSVVRWEKTTRPFLRTSEFLWQEGHTMHATAEEAQAETLKMLKVYTDFYAETLAIPAVVGQKTEKEKFAGAEATYTIEPMMHNGVALQGGTSHYFGDGFAKSFGITYTGKDNKLHYPHQTSWGVSTRMIGALIMVHSDDDGLVLPPKVAPIQVALIPIAQHKEGVLEKADELKAELSKKFRVKLDDSDHAPGWKFAEYEMKGVPVRVEIGPKDIEKNQCVVVRRDTREKAFVPLEGLSEYIENLLKTIHKDMYDRAAKNTEEKTFVARTHEEFIDTAKNHPGFIKAMWCGDSACEDQLKDETGGVKSRCIPFEEEHLADICVCCGKPAKHMVFWGKQY